MGALAPSKERSYLMISATYRGDTLSLSKRRTDFVEPRQQEKKHKTADKEADIVRTFGKTGNVAEYTVFTAIANL
jgi:hypothetical protein